MQVSSLPLPHRASPNSTPWQTPAGRLAHLTLATQKAKLHVSMGCAKSMQQRAGLQLHGLHGNSSYR